MPDNIESDDEKTEDLLFFKGVINGFIISIPIWALIITAYRLLT